MDFEEEIYHRNRYFEKTLCNLEKSKISDENKKTIREFVQEKLASHPPLSKSRATRYVATLRELAQLLAKNFCEAKIDDIKRAVAELGNRSYSENTIYTFKSQIKTFYKWLRKNERPEEVSWFKDTKPPNTITRKDLLEKEEIERLIAAAKNPRDRSLICLLYETGARIGEVLRMQVKHVTINNDGECEVLIPKGKTFARQILLPSKSTRLLKEWIQSHPTGKNPEAPLWIRYDGKPMPYSTARDILNNVSRRSGITKRVYPYKLRHTRATKMAELGMSDAQMKAFFGWTQGSSIQQVYVHLSGRDLSPVLRKIYQLEEDGQASSQSNSSTAVPKISPEELVAQVAKEITNKLFKKMVKTDDDDDEE